MRWYNEYTSDWHRWDAKVFVPAGTGSGGGTTIM
jgi:4-aminobutyrate aminotransferase-like enzyme